jgi:hypothetical protein
MGTLLGIVIGVSATILVARYYFTRTVNKKLNVYQTLNNRLFEGIESNVKKNLEFKYNGEIVKELQQIDLIIANDGERAIRDCIEPLTLQISKPVRILDVSILHRFPSDLRVKLSTEAQRGETASIKCEFPLLNSGEFFFVKLLLDGYVNRADIKCNILADDLPRSFQINHLPSSAIKGPKRRVEWSGVVMGGFFLMVAFAICLLVWNYYQLNPSIFPIPWQNFQPSWIETPTLIFLSFIVLCFTLIGMVVIFGMGFEDFFGKHLRFPLPEELRSRSYKFASFSEFRELKRSKVEEPTEVKNPKETSIANLEDDS